MAIIDLKYIEIDGLLYPRIEVKGSEILKNFGNMEPAFRVSSWI